MIRIFRIGKNLYQFSSRNSIGIETSNTEDIKTHNITTSFWKKIRSRWFVKMPIIMSIDFSCQENSRKSECGTFFFSCSHANTHNKQQWITWEFSAHKIYSQIVYLHKIAQKLLLTNCVKGFRIKKN